MQPTTLTTEEIIDITSRGFSAPFKATKRGGLLTDHAKQVHDSMKARLVLQLINEKLTPLAKEDLIEEMKFRFERSAVEPGTYVGISAAEAIGGPVTQASLGKDPSKKNLRGGADALKEILLVPKQRKVELCHIFFKRPYTYFDILNFPDLESISIDTLAADAPDIIPIESDEYDTWWNQVQRLEYPDFPTTGYALRLKLNVTELVKTRVTLEMLKDSVISALQNNVYVFHSPMSEGIVDFIYKSDPNIVSSLSSMGITTFKELQYSDVNRLMLLLGPVVVRGVEDIRDIVPYEIMVNSFVRAEYMMSSDAEWTTWEVKLKTNMARRFVDDITSKYMWLCEACGLVAKREDNRLFVKTPTGHKSPNATIKARYKVENTAWKEANRSLLHDRNWVMKPFPEFMHRSVITYAEAKGGNYMGLLLRDDIDITRTVPNNFHKIYRYLGTEAVRNYHTIEFTETLGEKSGYLSNRHITLLSDVMTNRGGINPVFQAGGGFLTRATRSDAMKIFKQSGMVGKSESLSIGKVTSVASVATGVSIQGGTGKMTQLLIDDEMVERYQGVNIEELETTDDIMTQVYDMIKSTPATNLPASAPVVPIVRENEMYLNGQETIAVREQMPEIIPSSKPATGVRWAPVVSNNLNRAINDIVVTTRDMVITAEQVSSGSVKFAIAFVPLPGLVPITQNNITIAPPCPLLIPVTPESLEQKTYSYYK